MSNQDKPAKPARAKKPETEAKRRQRVKKEVREEKRAQTAAAMERRGANWAPRAKAYQEERVAEQEAEAAAQKKAERRLRANRGKPLPKAEKKPETVSVYVAGRQRVQISPALDPIAAMYARDQVTAEQYEASKKFTKDFDIANFTGLSCVGFDEAVDGGGHDSGGMSVICRLQLSKLEKEVGPIHFAALVLICGNRLSIRELAAQGLGQPSYIGELLRDALNGAVAFYSNDKRQPLSRFMKRAREVVEAMKRGDPRAIKEAADKL